MSTLVSDRSQQPARRRTRKPATETSANPALPCRVRLEDGRIFSASLPAARHRALQLGMLHTDSNGLVELAAGRREDGKLRIVTRPRPPRTRPDHFLPGGSSGREGWLAGLLALAERHANRGEEVFFAPAVRSQPRPDRHAVSHTHTLWVDVDRPEELPRLWAFLAERPCHLLAASGGSGGAHAYWRLREPLDATRVREGTGELVEPIERAHLRIIHHLGVDENGKPNVGDTQCAERSRVMRLVGTINNKTGQYARILEADLALPGYDVRELVGGLPDPAPLRPAPATQPSGGWQSDHSDPYKTIPPPVYFAQLAGIDVPAGGGLVSCPAHDDRDPSCSVGAGPEQGWRCHSDRCGARGAIYDLASVLVGGPTGQELRGEEFKRAQAYVRDVFGELT